MTRVQAAWTSIGLIAVGTYAIRASLLSVAHRATDLSPRVRTGLRMIPPAALAAIAAPPLLRPGGQLSLWSPELLAGLIAFGVAWRWRNMIATVVVGMAALLLLRATF